MNFLDPMFLEKEINRFRIKVGVFLLLIQNDELLMLRRYNTGIGDGHYVVPMGGLLERETITQALVRETLEETGINLVSDKVQVCHVMHRFQCMAQGYSFPQIDVYFKTDSWQGTIANQEPHKRDELKFYPLQALPNKTEDFILHAIGCM